MYRADRTRVTGKAATVVAVVRREAAARRPTKAIRAPNQRARARVPKIAVSPRARARVKARLKRAKARVRARVRARVPKATRVVRVARVIPKAKEDHPLIAVAVAAMVKAVKAVKVESRATRASRPAAARVEKAEKVLLLLDLLVREVKEGKEEVMIRIPVQERVAREVVEIAILLVRAVKETTLRDLLVRAVKEAIAILLARVARVVRAIIPTATPRAKVEKVVVVEARLDPLVREEKEKEVAEVNQVQASRAHQLEVVEVNQAWMIPHSLRPALLRRDQPRHPHPAVLNRLHPLPSV